MPCDLPDHACGWYLLQVTREVAPFMSALKTHDAARKERSQLSSPQSRSSKRLPWWALV